MFVFFVVVGVIEELTSLCDKYLGYCIFVEHAFVDGKFVAENLIIKIIAREFAFAERQTNKETGIYKIRFYGTLVERERNADGGIITFVL